MLGTGPVTNAHDSKWSKTHERPVTFVHEGHSIRINLHVLGEARNGDTLYRIVFFDETTATAPLPEQHVFGRNNVRETIRQKTHQLFAEQ